MDQIFLNRPTAKLTFFGARLVVVAAYLLIIAHPALVFKKGEKTIAEMSNEKLSGANSEL